MNANNFTKNKKILNFSIKKNCAFISKVFINYKEFKAVLTSSNQLVNPYQKIKLLSEGIRS